MINNNFRNKKYHLIFTMYFLGFGILIAIIVSFVNYQLFSPNRRRERRSDIIEMLKSEYRVQDVIGFSGLEWDNLFLEGTGGYGS